MAELQLISQNPPDDFFDIDELIKDDPDIIIDANDPELLVVKYLYAIRKIEKEIDDFKVNAENTIKEINSWLERKVEQKQKQIEFFCFQMKNYLQQKKLKSLSLPSGTIGFRKQQDKVEVSDYATFLANAPISIIKVVPEKFEPDLTAIKNKIKETGEIPDGVEITPQEAKFYYKLNNGVEK